MSQITKCVVYCKIPFYCMYIPFGDNNVAKAAGRGTGLKQLSEELGDMQSPGQKIEKVNVEAQCGK